MVAAVFLPPKLLGYTTPDIITASEFTDLVIHQRKRRGLGRLLHVDVLGGLVVVGAIPVPAPAVPLDENLGNAPLGCGMEAPSEGAVGPEPVMAGSFVASWPNLLLAPVWIQVSQIDFE